MFVFDFPVLAWYPKKVEKKGGLLFGAGKKLLFFRPPAHPRAGDALVAAQAAGGDPRYGPGGCGDLFGRGRAGV